jgi:hypothetical protein
VCFVSIFILSCKSIWWWLSSLTLCRRVVNLIKYPLVPGRFKFFECSTPKCTIWLCRLVSYTYWRTHSQNSAWENDESRDRASKRVTEKATLVVARLQCVKYNSWVFKIFSTFEFVIFLFSNVLFYFVLNCFSFQLSSILFFLGLSAVLAFWQHFSFLQKVSISWFIPLFSTIY